ncbi:lantibiotic dehydratase [Streptomyces sp. NPDC008163]|uniref:lantibiotic dehydratase n=1 Tax=Streptomyces sp. NPDC008163 TaxID=3364818 RepID=UPI0036E30025
MTDTMQPQDKTPGSHRTPLGSTRWSLWKDVALRSAGFPAARAEELRDPELAQAADRAAQSPEQYAKVYAEAAERLKRTTRRVAADLRFREAVAWQNPDLIANCLDKAARGEPRNVRGRNHELAITSYLQRYALKNDTVGFFGPVGWATADPSVPSFGARPGPDLLRRRTTYFEVWAIDELARAIAAQEGVLPWLTPRPEPACTLAGQLLHLPLRRPARLSAPAARLFALCDGTRTVQAVAALAADPGDGSTPCFPDEQAALTALLRLRDHKALRVDLQGPMEAWPERSLRRRLEAIGEPAIRARAIAPLDELVAARDAVDAAAGNAKEVLAATQRLGEVFSRHTGVAATRAHGRTYAGRTLVYQDTVRDVEIQLGRQVLDAMAQPLGLVLDSARWLTGTVAQRYHARFLEHFARECARAKAKSVPLSRLMLVATPDLLTPSSRVLPALVSEVVTDFQRRWQELLQVPANVRRHRLGVEGPAASASRLFPFIAPAWSNATQHSPDLMIAAAGPEALSRGDFQLVLGEIHLAVNTLESRLFVEQHDAPERLVAAATDDQGGRRIYSVPRKSSPYVTSRVSPPTALLSSGFQYWSSGEEAVDCPVKPLPVVDLEVHLSQGRLMVRSRASGREFDFVEMIGEILSATVANAFKPFPGAAHQPRVTLDRLVLCRESWTFDPEETGWAFIKDESARFAAARAWTARHGIPERAFYKVPVEDKPTAVDFTSIPLVNIFAKAVRRTHEAQAGTLSVSEMLPDTGGLWLEDADGERYTAELRCVAVDRPAPSTPVHPSEAPC